MQSEYGLHNIMQIAEPPVCFSLFYSVFQRRSKLNICAPPHVVTLAMALSMFAAMTNILLYLRGGVLPMVCEGF